MQYTEPIMRYFSTDEDKKVPSERMETAPSELTKIFWSWESINENEGASLAQK